MNNNTSNPTVQVRRTRLTEGAVHRGLPRRGVRSLKAARRCYPMTAHGRDARFFMPRSTASLDASFSLSLSLSLSLALPGFLRGNCNAAGQ
jgi:hypothetical protein